tara:strand:+ start:177 stop:656 length:480 start_codon:yes stop_codon:yes gene_type:complete
MKINENQVFPKTEFYIISDSGPVSVKSSDLFNKTKVLLIGVPGAFTPTCNDEHLPGFFKLLDDFEKKGIESIYVVSNNDPFVMKSWGESLGNDKFLFISDGNGTFRELSGLETDLSVVGLGKRLSRFVIYIENENIKKIFNENGPGLEVSKAENVLKSL